ncbi:MAG: hypothetical protein ABS87_13365 [Sphingomonas sp. SCN 67-18]|nr:MAG: hypothetical protein ABS87_13365 [Sphingomonas sp. SCN 67-18]
MMKPAPKAAPSSPKACTRLSRGVASATIACAGANTAPSPPATARPRNSQSRLGANAITA